jgi:hypothetical protein
MKHFKGCLSLGNLCLRLRLAEGGSGLGHPYWDKSRGGGPLGSLQLLGKPWGLPSYTGRVCLIET